MNTPIGIIGDGRVATHFARYLSALGLPFRQWSRRRGGTPDFAGCEVVALLVRDDAIEAVAARPELRGFRKVHFSGSLVTASAESAHWLGSFGPEPLPLETYRRIPFVVERGRTKLPELFPGLENPWFEIEAAEKPLYHSLCVMSGNFTALLWKKAFADLSARFGIPHAAVVPYLETVVASLAASPERALTGPIARGDLGTLRLNLLALHEARDNYESVYRAFVNAHVKESL